MRKSVTKYVNGTRKTKNMVKFCLIDFIAFFNTKIGWGFTKKYVGCNFVVPHPKTLTVHKKIFFFTPHHVSKTIEVPFMAMYKNKMEPPPPPPPPPPHTHTHTYTSPHLLPPYGLLFWNTPYQTGKGIHRYKFRNVL